jgi:hypothetical protein
VNERQEGGNCGCVIRIECKQPVKGRGFKVNSGVQLVALMGRKWRFRGLEAGSSRGFSVNPALGGRAKCLNGPARFEVDRPRSGWFAGKADDIGGVSDGDLHPHDWPGVIAVVHLGNYRVVSYWQNHQVVL